MNNASGQKGCSQQLDEVRPEEADPARRELLIRLGRFAYAAPALALLARPQRAQAGYGRGGSKPGWGYGDKNHTHSGPPGLAKK